MNEFYQNIGPLNLQHLIDESPDAAVSSTCLLLDGYKVHMHFPPGLREDKNQLSEAQ